MVGMAECKAMHVPMETRLLTQQGQQQPSGQRHALPFHRRQPLLPRSHVAGHRLRRGVREPFHGETHDGAPQWCCEALAAVHLRYSNPWLHLLEAW